MFTNLVKKEKVYRRLIIWNWLNAGLLILFLITVDFIFAYVYPNLVNIYNANGLTLPYISEILIYIIFLISILGYIYACFLIIKKPNYNKVMSQLKTEKEDMANIKRYNYMKPELISSLIMVILTLLIIYGLIIPSRISY